MSNIKTIREESGSIIKRRKEREANKKSASTSDQKNISVKSIEIKKRNAKIRDFVNTVIEVNSIVSIAFTKNLDDDDIAKSTLAYLKLQERVKKTVLDKFLIDKYDKELKRSGLFLGSEISNLIANGTIRGHNEKKLGEIVDLITEVNASSIVIRDVYSDINISSDTLVNIKCSIFPFAIKMEQILHELGASQQEKLIQIQWFHSTSLSLAKDIAFNWDKHSGFREREVLFENMLKFCCGGVYETWIEMINDYFNMDYIHLDEETITKSCHKLFEKIDEQSMGYNDHPDMNIEWLKQKISKYIYEIIESKRINLLSPKMNGIYFNFILNKLNKTLPDMWEKECESFIERITNLTEEERKEWLSSSDGQRPMPIDNLQNRINQFISIDLPKEIKFDLNNDNLENSAARRFAMLWGMSNAICKTKK